MPIQQTDIQYRLSGGSGNTNPALSLGGAISNTAITENSMNALWANVTGDQAEDGHTAYRCIYVRNGHGTLIWTLPVMWVTIQTPSVWDEIDIGVGTAAAGGVEQIIATETTAPTSVTFNRPLNKASGRALGSIAAGSHKAIWFRRTVTAGAQIFNPNYYQIKCEGDTLE